MRNYPHHSPVLSAIEKYSAFGGIPPTDASYSIFHMNSRKETLTSGMLYG
ncbi:hypothetical protein QLX67_13145 [Balneolaceae bacterium ANBcel3]|nr:hypothetical protein [Balneolaceae bacterium ANBcel3]